MTVSPCSFGTIDEAIAFYTQPLRFNLIEDAVLGYGKRWVRVSPPGSHNTCLLLAKASTPEQERHIGNQAGGRVFLFLRTNGFWRDYHDMKARGVRFREEPRHEAYGTVAVFEDLYGNKWDLLEHTKPNQPQHPTSENLAEAADQPSRHAPPSASDGHASTPPPASTCILHDQSYIIYGESSNPLNSNARRAGR